MPVFVQLTLAVTFGAVGALVLSRGRGSQDVEAPEVKAASIAAAAVTLIALIWVAFQGYAAVALATMWRTERAGLGALVHVSRTIWVGADLRGGRSTWAGRLRPLSSP